MTIEAANPISTIKLKFCLLSSPRPSPSFFAIMAFAPTPSNSPMAIANDRNGKITLTGAKATGPIKRDTNIPSTVPNVLIINIDSMVGNANFKRCFHVGVLVMLSAALAVLFLALFFGIMSSRRQSCE
jgi:hypothetical protein